MDRSPTQEEEELIHHAAENVQRVVRGIQARAKTPPIALEAQASAELSADFNFADDNNIHHSKVLELHADDPKPTTMSNVKSKKASSPSSSLSHRKTKQSSSPSSSLSHRKTKQSPPRFTTNRSAAISIQKSMRGYLGRDQVRIKRGSMQWNNINIKPKHGWISVNDLQRKRYYYYHNETNVYRWDKPSPIVFLPAYHFFDAISGLASKVDIAARIDLYTDTIATESIERAQSKIKSSFNKCKSLFAQEKQCINHYVEDMESVEAGFDILEESHQSTTDFIDGYMMDELITAQSSILEKLSLQIDKVHVDLNKNINSGLLKNLGKKPGDPNITDMYNECKRAIYDVIGWWEKEEDSVPEDTRIYLHMEGWNGKSRSDWYPIHNAITSSNNCVNLLKNTLSRLIMNAKKEGEKLRESENLKLMKLEEISQRSIMRRLNQRAELWAKKENELTMLRSAWRYGLHLKEKDMKEHLSKIKNNKLARDLMKTERIYDRHHQNNVIENKIKHNEATNEMENMDKHFRFKMLETNHLTKYKNSPWYGVERGCTRYELEELISEERKRRTNQEGKKIPFHVDDTEHETGKLLLHTACFWGHGDLVEYLLARGANPNKIDSCVTKFTPLDEACRGGNPNVVKLILNASSQYSGNSSSKVGRKSGESSYQKNNQMQAMFFKNIHGDTPIHTAARDGRSQAMNELINFCKNNGDGGNMGPDGGGTAIGADNVFNLIDCTNDKHKTPLQLTTNEGVKELLLAASEWAIDARANQGVFGMAMKKKKKRKGKNTMGKWLQELNPNAY
jgi:hypothetical protein